jgi:hypothetical protein
MDAAITFNLQNPKFRKISNFKSQASPPPFEIWGSSPEV